MRKCYKNILTQHFSDDDTRHTDLRNEFRKVAGEDKKTAAKANGIKSKLGKTVLKAAGLARGITDPSAEEQWHFKKCLSWIPPVNGMIKTSRPSEIYGWLVRQSRLVTKKEVQRRSQS